MTTLTSDVEAALEQHRGELTGYCYRMLASPFDAEDAVQETMLRAWRSADRFEGRASVRTWLYRIASNVCIDMAEGRARRAMPMDLGPAREPRPELLATPDVPWVEPMPDAELDAPGTGAGLGSSNPETAAFARESIRLAYVTAIQCLPARQRAVLLLREVLGLSAAEVADLLEASEASVNSALQRARATLDERRPSQDAATAAPVGAGADLRDQLDRFVAAFERYEVGELEQLLRDDAVQSMPPYDLWLAGRDDVLAWWFGPGIGCAGSRLVPAGSTGGTPVWGQYKPAASGSGYEAWALCAFELDADGRLEEATFFLDHARLFPRFGLPPTLDADGEPDIHR